MGIPHGGIAFFDSGIGGLTVLAECLKRLPNELFYYYGDNARAPYGNLPPERIYGYVEESMELFASLHARAVVLACNTATAVCIETLRKKYAFPIIGAEPAVLPAVKASDDVLVLSTCATQSSARFSRLCQRVKKQFPTVRLTLAPCHDLAKEIENHVLDSAYSYAPFLPTGNPSAVVLGCTHYVYAKEQIQKHYNCPVFDGNEGIANRLVERLFSPENTFAEQNIRDERPLVTTARPPKIYFLGGEKSRNLRVFEHMFAKYSK